MYSSTAAGAPRHTGSGKQASSGRAGGTNGHARHAPEAPPLTNGLTAAQTGLSCFFSDMAASWLWLSSLRAAVGGR